MGTLPSFVIIGEMKAGTTSLYHALTDNPLIIPAKTKELHYLSQTHATQKGYSKYFPNLKENQITGEATPNYLTSEIASKNAKKIIPSTKFIALLRNPSERVFSQYWGYVRKSRKRKAMPRCKNFEEYYQYLIKNPTQQGKVNYVGKWGIKRSIYYSSLKNWYKHFPKKQIMIIKSEDMFKNINKITNEVLKWLEIPTHKLEREFHYLERKFQNNRLGVRTVPMNKKDKEFLKEYFKPFNKKLYTLINRDMEWENE